MTTIALMDVQRFNFASSKLTELAANCPWRLGNTNETIIETRPDSQLGAIEIYQKLGLEKNANGLRDGLEMTY